MRYFPIGIPSGWEEIAAFWSFFGEFPPDAGAMCDDIRNRITQYLQPPECSERYYDWSVEE